MSDRYWRKADVAVSINPKLLRVRWRLALLRPAWLLRWSLQWRQLRPLLDADADRADLELRLIKLLLKDRARVHPFAGNGGSSAKPAVAESGGFESHKSDLQLVCNALISLGRNTIT